MLILSRKNFICKLSIIISLFLLNSCLTIESDIKLNSNGSGYMDMKYILDKGLDDISNLDDTSSITPLNLSRSYLDQVIAERTDIYYDNYNINESGENITITVRFNFENIDALNSILPDESSISLERVGSETIFTQNIVDSRNEPINNESYELLEDIFKQHYFKFTLTAPEEITDISGGELQGKKVAVFKEQFIDVLSDPNKKQWIVRW